MLRYNTIRKMDVSNGLGIGVSLFTQGCPFHCPGCFNPETWDASLGHAFTEIEKRQVLDLIKPEYISRITILGGEPLIVQNFEYLEDLILAIRASKPEIKIWIYSGYTVEELLHKAYCFPGLSRILHNIDVLVDGPFIQEQRDITLAFRGSANQRLIDMRATLEKGEIQLLSL